MGIIKKGENSRGKYHFEIMSGDSFCELGDKKISLGYKAPDLDGLFLTISGKPPMFTVVKTIEGRYEVLNEGLYRAIYGLVKGKLNTVLDFSSFVYIWSGVIPEWFYFFTEEYLKKFETGCLDQKTNFISFVRNEISKDESFHHFVGDKEILEVYEHINGVLKYLREMKVCVSWYIPADIK
jgi:hypothetical protein